MKTVHEIEGKVSAKVWPREFNPGWYVVRVFHHNTFTGYMVKGEERAIRWAQKQVARWASIN